MAATPWAVMTTKRKKTPASSFSSRKRQKFNVNTPGTVEKKQQTLTQIPWAQPSPPNFGDVAELENTDTIPRSASRAQSSKNKRLTLTQMNFFDLSNPSPGAIMDSELEEIDMLEQPARIMQLDGTYESPRKPRKRKSTNQAVLKESPKTRKDCAHSKSGESQEYIPYTRKRRKTKDVTEDLVCEPPRSSLRIKSRDKIPSDPTVSQEYFTTAFSKQETWSKNDKDFENVLEIKDSNESAEPVEGELLVPPKNKETVSPQTPQKRRTIVLSSQSPETIQPLSKHKIINLYSPKFKRRTPLRERSVNLVSMSRSVSKARDVWRSPQHPTSEHNIVTLKLPKKTSMSSKIGARDAGEEQYQGSKTRFGQFTEDTLLRNPQNFHIAEEVPATPSTPLKPALDTENMEEVGDFRESDETESVLGSPVPNDTQFNHDYEQRTSSPRMSDTDDAAHGWQNKISSVANRTNDMCNETEVKQHCDSENPSFPQIPKPRLVSQRASTATFPALQHVASEEILLPKTFDQSQSEDNILISKVPLNDRRSSSALSKSDMMKLSTQRSVHPASLPHPSQMSTQEATQAYLGMSSMVPPEELQNPSSDRITIKDSSSLRVALSEVPRYKQSQSQYDIALVPQESTGDDEIEFDLDPFSERHRSSPQPEEITPKASLPHDPARVNSFNLNQDQSKLSHHEQNDDKIFSSQGDSDLTVSSPNPPPLMRQYSPIPGFNNETQSNFTQNGHVTAAYIHRQREAGLLPSWYTPQPFQVVPGYRKL